ncbi:MAG: uracil-DNA glycosylase [Desulfobacteraceae bacterium]|jgi:DNA polymerase
MEEQVFRPVEEFREIVSHLKKLVVANMEMGLEGPTLSPSSLDYLDTRTSGFTSLEDLRKYIGDCKRCKLGYGRTNLVFGEGSPQARLVFVGEGPGREEDQAGLPFVGEAGRLLNKIINAMGLSREEVYICNVVKCRPPKNRDPEGDEIETCLPFLKEQLNLIRPQVICTLGRIAVQALLGKDFKITRERGRWHSFMDIPLMPTYHPAYLLRNPSAKRQVWDDIQKIMKHVGLEVKKDA